MEYSETKACVESKLVVKHSIWMAPGDLTSLVDLSTIPLHQT